MSLLQILRPNRRILYCQDITAAETVNAQAINAETVTATSLNVITATIVANNYYSEFTGGILVRNSYLVWQRLWAPLQFIGIPLGVYQKINTFVPTSVSPAYTGSHILNCERGNQYEIDVSYIITITGVGAGAGVFFRMPGTSDFAGVMGSSTDITTVNSPYQGVIKVIFTIESYDTATGACVINYTYTQNARNWTGGVLSNNTLHQTVTYVADPSRINGVLPLDFGIIVPAFVATPVVSVIVSNVKVTQTC